MIIYDKVYSKFEITSPLAIELINTPSFQRLKNISQTGIPTEYYHRKVYTRYDHSIGVYILLNKLNASEKEQIAGLLHDISHTAFSHVIDWVIGNRVEENYQDLRHLSILQKEEISQLLSKYGYDPKDIAHLEQYELLEQNIPNLCADRIDYSLREFPESVAKKCISSLTVHKNKIVFSDQDKATLFANNFLWQQNNHWTGYESSTRYVLLSDLLKNALQEKVIKIDDFYETDSFVLQKIINTHNPKYLSVLDVLKSKDLSHLPKSKIPVYKKFRFVDPKVLINKKLVKLSQINKTFSKKLSRSKLSNKKGIFTGTIK